MKSFNNAGVARPRAEEPVFFSAWALTDLRDARMLEVQVSPGDAWEEDPAVLAEQEAIALAEAEQRRLEMERIDAERRSAEEQERRVRQAYADGYEEGRREGEIAEGARLRTALRVAEEALDELRAGEARWTGSIEENICALAVAVARHVIGRELAADVTPVLELVRSALAEFPVDQPIRVRVNPGDMLLMRQSGDGEDPLASVTHGRDARWIADSQMAPGGCIVEGRERIIDGRVDTALERVYRRLTYSNA